jgi:hypothetical protein
MLKDGQALKFDFPSGYGVTRGTVKLLAEAVRLYSVHPRIRARARQITAGLASMDIDGEIRAVWDFVLGHIRYLRDPIFAEYVTAPDKLDEMIDEGTGQEDCEGVALYAATLLASMGIESEFEIQGRNPAKPKRFSHCALRVLNPRTKQWISFDPIGHWEAQAGTFGDASFDLGDSLHLPGEPIEHWQLDGRRSMSGFMGDLFDDCGLGDNRSNIDQTKQYTDPVADALVNFGPYGALIGGALKTGTQIADANIPQGGAKSQSQSKTISKKGPLTYKGARPTSATLKDPNLLKETDWKKPLLIGGVALVAAKLMGVI